MLVVARLRWLPESETLGVLAGCWGLACGMFGVCRQRLYSVVLAAGGYVSNLLLLRCLLGRRSDRVGGHCFTGILLTEQVITAKAHSDFAHEDGEMLAACPHCLAVLPSVDDAR